MRFTLVFDGDLLPNGNSRDKWKIRRDLEPQLRALWTSEPVSDILKYQDKSYKPDDCYVGRILNDIEYVPLISPKLHLFAELEISILSAQRPGGIVNNSGDIDNRIKTLFDALSVPRNQQIPPHPDVENDRRLFCLLDDDRLITRIDVSNERLLTEREGSRRSIVIIRVKPVAFRVTYANIGLVG